MKQKIIVCKSFILRINYYLKIIHLLRFVMRNIISYLVLLCFIFISFKISAQDAPHKCAVTKQKQYSKFDRLNEISYPGDTNINVTYYKLDLQIDYSTQSLAGTVTVEGKSQKQKLEQFYLDLSNSGLTVDSVISDNRTYNYEHFNDKLNLNPVGQLNEGEKFSVNIHYHGTPESIGFGSFIFDSHNNNPIIWTLSEPFGAHTWFPCKDTPADKVDSSDVWVRADETFVTVSNGNLVDIIDHGDGTKTYKWKNSYPIAQYLISLAMTNYELYTNEYIAENQDTLKMYHYNLPNNLTESRKNKLDATIGMMEVFEDKFGEYPFMQEKYGHAEFLWVGAMEHQTVSSMDAFNEYIVAHELAHQWFGNKITCKNWHHIWLNEGFATYAESVYLEETEGIEAYHSSINDEMEDAKNATGTIYVQTLTISEIFNGLRSYSKAAVVLHMLRGVLGKATFFDVLKSYANDPDLSYDVAATKDFKEIAEEVSGQELDYFFEQWIYQAGYPEYSIDWSYNENSTGNYEVELNVDQTNSKLFQMPVDIKFSFQEGDTLVNVFNDQFNQSFNFTLNKKPVNLTFDPENFILKDIEPVTGVKNNILREFKLSQNYPNPFNPTTKIKFTLPERSQIKLTVYNSLGEKVSELVNDKLNAGTHSVNFNASKFNSGVYFYKIESDRFQAARKMLLLK